MSKKLSPFMVCDARDLNAGNKGVKPIIDKLIKDYQSRNPVSGAE